VQFCGAIKRGGQLHVVSLAERQYGVIQECKVRCDDEFHSLSSLGGLHSCRGDDPFDERKIEQRFAALKFDLDPERFGVANLSRDFVAAEIGRFRSGRF
jgi:hypothetical protein